MWTPGESWHFSDGNYTWLNYTVTGEEEKAGELTYRVHREHRMAAPHGWFRYNATEWFAKSDLAQVSVQGVVGGEVTVECPRPRFFPLENRSYECRRLGQSERITVTIEVLGWESLPRGPAVHIRTIPGESVPFEDWYDPDVGFWSQTMFPEFNGDRTRFFLVHHHRPSDAGTPPASVA